MNLESAELQHAYKPQKTKVMQTFVSYIQVSYPKMMKLLLQCTQKQFLDGNEIH